MPEHQKDAEAGRKDKQKIVLERKVLQHKRRCGRSRGGN